MGTPKVYIPAVPATVVAGVTVSWAQGKQLLVCMASKELGTGFVPLPGGGMGYGFLKTMVYMSIEVGIPTVVPTYDKRSTTDIDPTGQGWGWCS